eukprot:4721475-Pleurochrysis_carterae.AAC.1
MRRRELDLNAVARMARGSTGAAVRRGVMAACARVNGAEERARVAEEWPGGSDSAAKPSESAADGMEKEDLLASASSLA